MNLQQAIQEFEQQTGITLVVKDGRPYYAGDLYLNGCENLTSLPEGLTVGGWLYLRGCENLTSLPEGLTVGGDLYLRGTDIKDVNVSQEMTPAARASLDNLHKQVAMLLWLWNDKEYIKIDGIFSIIDSHHGNVWQTHRIGKEETLYIVTDGEGHYAHGASVKEAKADLIYKINDRDTSAYKSLTLDDTLSYEEAIVAYRTITGACAAGTRDFVEHRLPKPHKASYTIREILALTNGEYGCEKIKTFFSKKD